MSRTGDATGGRTGDQPVLHQNLPLIETAEAALLDQVMADRTAAGQILLRLSDRVAVVDPAGANRLIARLRKLGHLPQIVNPPPTPAEPAASPPPEEPPEEPPEPPALRLL